MCGSFLEFIVETAASAPVQMITLWWPSSSPCRWPPGVALYISEYAPRCLRRALINTVGLMAAVPSMVFGLWCFYLLTRCSSCTG